MVLSLFVLLMAFCLPVLLIRGNNKDMKDFFE